jgi:hypothetical protein
MRGIKVFLCFYFINNVLFPTIFLKTDADG